MADTVLPVLVRARELLAQGWTQGTFARDAANRPVPPEAPDAACWCVEGAIWKARDEVARAGSGGSVTFASDAIFALQDALDAYPHIFNDALGRTQAEVLAALDAAIDAASEEAA